MQLQELQMLLTHRQNLHDYDDDVQQPVLVCGGVCVVLAYVHDLPYEPGGHYVVWVRCVALVLQLPQLI